MIGGADGVGAQGARSTVKVLDFGIAKFTAFDGSVARTAALTSTGSILGTPFYMSPEQILGEADVDHRADVRALGIVLDECLTGKAPLP
jgi:serine/threonine-protein kinase